MRLLRWCSLRSPVFPLLACAVIGLLAAPASARTWTSREQDGIALYVEAPDTLRAPGLMAELIAGREAVVKKLGVATSVPMSVYLAPNQVVFDSLTQGRLPHWSAAVAFPESHTIVLKSGQSDEAASVVRHEMTHVIMHAAVSVRTPVWFDEGVAMWASQEWRLGQTASVLYAVLSGGLIPLSAIDSVLAFPSAKADLAYTESLLAVTFAIHLGGPNAVPAMVADMADGAPFVVALFRVTGKTPRNFERQWADYVSGRFGLTSLLVSPDALWFYLVLLLLLAYVAVRVRNRARMRQWETEDPTEGLPLRLRLQVHQREDEP